MARPTDLTPDTQKRICDALRMGATYEHAAAFGGVSYSAFNNWRKRGEVELERIGKARKNVEIAESELPFVQFLQAVKDAEAAAVVGWLAKIEKAASGGVWQAAAWKLERRYPAEYGRTVVDHNMDFRTMSDDELRAIAEGKSSR